jgi:hypothetical protein
MQEATSREEGEERPPWVEEAQMAHAEIQWEVDLEREEETG